MAPKRKAVDMDAGEALYIKYSQSIADDIEELDDPNERLGFLLAMVHGSLANAVRFAMVIAETELDPEEQAEAIQDFMLTVAEVVQESIIEGSAVAGEPTLAADVTLEVRETGSLDDSPPPAGTMIN